MARTKVTKTVHLSDMKFHEKQAADWEKLHDLLSDKTFEIGCPDVYGLTQEEVDRMEAFTTFAWEMWSKHYDKGRMIAMELLTAQTK